MNYIDKSKGVTGVVNLIIHKTRTERNIIKYMDIVS